MYNAKKDPIGNVREQVLTKTWQYLFTNFDNFSEANKIKIALALATKNIPQQVEGSLNVTLMPTVKIDGKDLEVKLG